MARTILTKEQRLAEGAAASLADQIERLWQSASRFENNQISGSAPAMLTAGVIQSKPKCLAVAAWIQSLWAEYYVRRAAILAGQQVSYDFSSFGTIPYPVPELMAEVFGA